MKWEVVSLSIDAPLIPEPAGKDTGIPGACLECDRKKKKRQPKTLQTNKTSSGEGWEEAGWRAGVSNFRTEAEYAFLWFSFMFLHKAFFMLSCYFIAVFLMYLGCQTKKSISAPMYSL